MNLSTQEREYDEQQHLRRDASAVRGCRSRDSKPCRLAAPARPDHSPEADGGMETQPTHRPAEGHPRNQRDDRGLVHPVLDVRQRLPPATPADQQHDGGGGRIHEPAFRTHELAVARCAQVRTARRSPVHW